MCNSNRIKSQLILDHHMHLAFALLKGGGILTKMDASFTPRFIYQRNVSLWSLILALEYQVTKDIILHKGLTVRSLNLNKYWS